MSNYRCSPVVSSSSSDRNHQGLCVMDRTWHVTECLRLLSDACTYRPIPAASMPGITSDLQRTDVKIVSTVATVLTFTGGQVSMCCRSPPCRCPILLFVAKSSQAASHQPGAFAPIY